MNSDIAEPYCDWTEDKDARQTSPYLKKRLIFGLLAALSFILILVMFGISPSHPELGTWWPFVLIPLPVIFLAISNHAHNKSKTAEILCSSCGQSMKFTQHEYPKAPNTGLMAFIPVIHGEEGRIYVGGSSGDNPRWHRLMQSLRICEMCRRYIIIERKSFITIGSTESDVKEYEERVKSARKAVRHAKGRIIIHKHRKDRDS